MYFDREYKVKKYIRNGDLEGLRKLLEKKPLFLDKEIVWEDSAHYRRLSGSILHMAAYYDHADIVRFLITEKGMSVDNRNRRNLTPLYHAVAIGSPNAAKALLELGADPYAEDNNGIPVCAAGSKDATKDLLAPYLEEMKKRRAEERKQEALKRAEGTWKSVTIDEIVHRHEVPGGDYLLTEVFNFTAKTWTCFSEKLNGHHEGTKETIFFSEMPDQSMVEQARQKLSEIHGIAVAPVAKAEEKTPAPAPEPKKEEPAAPTPPRKPSDWAAGW